MIDVRLVRAQPDAVRAALARRHIDLGPLEEVIQLDQQVRELTGRRDALRARVRELSRQVGEAARGGDKDTAAALAAESRAVGEQEQDLGTATQVVEEHLRDRLLRIPNLPSDLAPDGRGEEDNPVVREHRLRADFAEHQRVPHWETGAALGILDLERATKLSGAMFTMLRGMGATLGRALCQLALDRNADAFEEVRAPSLVTSETLTATGHLPKFADDAFAIERDDLWAIPTAEVPLTSMYRDEVIAEADLPLRLMAYSPSYRREAGSAGRDTRGLLRTHEFDKVEILAYATAEQAPAVLEELLGRAEGTIAALGLDHRVIEICTGDMGQSHHRSFDVEVYAPGCDRWLEVSSVSWFSDYQARRANIRYRPAAGRGTELVHTLNGSALAVPRVLAAILETYRQPDGSVDVPEVLWPYTRGARRVEAR